MHNDRRNREFRDSQGREWMVHAVLPSPTPTGGRYLPEEYRDGWLLFVGASRRFRLAPIPADWLSCPMGDLLRLLARAEVADRAARGHAA